MYSHDYSKEIALKGSERQIPFPVAVVVFVLALVAVWFAYQWLKPLVPVDEPVAAADVKDVKPSKSVAATP